MTRKTPEIIEVNSQQMEELFERAASNTLREEDTELLRQIFDSYTQFFQIVGDKKTSIGRLRKLMFGSPTEKTKNVIGELFPLHRMPMVAIPTAPPATVVNRQTYVPNARVTGDLLRTTTKAPSRLRFFTIISVKAIPARLARAVRSMRKHLVCWYVSSGKPR